MSIGIVGRKRGMTRVFTDQGDSVPVTVIEATPSRVTCLRDAETDGYRAVQVAWGDKRRNLINKPAAGNLARAEVETAEGLLEFRLEEGDNVDLAPGAEIKVDIFKDGQKVDVSGTTIGKGFAGAIKRHHFSGQRTTHGNSRAHRAPGSIGQCQTPGRVLKGKRMAGQLGNVKRTTQNLEVVRVDAERNLLLIRGAVPGAKGGRVIITPAVKAGTQE
ncbi:MAG TPA: 50S ribosomal protein L3 [Gammaproteobacteria bacterium]|nr:50S ribosomal protein L3 [Gammaproteobacteria bacterium]